MAMCGDLEAAIYVMVPRNAYHLIAGTPDDFCGAAKKMRGVGILRFFAARRDVANNEYAVELTTSFTHVAEIDEHPITDFSVDIDVPGIIEGRSEVDIGNVQKPQHGATVPLPLSPTTRCVRESDAPLAGGATG